MLEKNIISEPPTSSGLDKRYPSTSKASGITAESKNFSGLFIKSSLVSQINNSSVLLFPPVPASSCRDRGLLPYCPPQNR